MGKYFETKINTKEVHQTLEEYAKEISDLKPAMRVAGQYLMSVINDNFESEGEESGEKWEPWTDKYYQVREKLGKADGKILQLVGQLKDSIIRKVTDNSVIIGTAKEYAAAHNFGFAPRNLTARPFMRFTDWHKEELAGEIAYDLKKRLASRIKNK